MSGTDDPLLIEFRLTGRERSLAAAKLSKLREAADRDALPFIEVLRAQLQQRGSDVIRLPAAEGLRLVLWFESLKGANLLTASLSSLSDLMQSSLSERRVV